ncbi:UDP-3-O-(3-hydroxymyristoyl)glucosamine N-acyltransferase [Methylobacillus gramineus]|uniref:UDP-3-O-(3-hydroxymyristoyl)glucosamine N-acyltransferase n=1 Tax=Methylobacillus gramineus TaxID=755169 RepID=UPI001CFF8D8D|nr:UDP-3-O-(3-hydroxymyristoyl)glucosamine N-acyltransferase [Methylobacillus gramineus]MCB5185807.1 UDP-3-O-(3-hydroxymyristoyl)glucosamine N-acyltransferase [Methylobacillus gramineus]
MKSRWVVGTGDYLDLAYHAWTQASATEDVQKITVPQGADYEFDLSIFDTLHPELGDVFIAVDDRFGNFKRMELFRVALERGFTLSSFVSANADVASEAKIGKNVFIGPQAIIGHHCKIEYNSVVHAGAQIGANSHLRASVWIEPGVQIGSRVEIGTHAIIRTGAIVRSGIKVGKGAELGWPQLYSADIADKTVYDTRYDEPILVYGS